MAYNPNFQWKRKTITITKGTDLPAGYQVKLTIVRSTDAPEAQTDFRDLRFETTDGYGLPHWIESIVSGTATVWVKLKDALTAATVDIYMYYGNPYVASTSNGINTFDIFDDFNKDLSQWTQTGTAHTVSGGVLQQRLTAKAAGQEVIIKPSSLTTGIWEYRLKKNSGGNMFIGAFLFGSSYNNAYLYIQYMNTGESYISKIVNGSHTALMTVSAISDIGTFHIIKATRDPTGIFKIYLDNTLLGTSPADTTFTSSTITGIGDPFGGDGSTADWDYVRARKYVATEPGTPAISQTSTTANWNPQRKKITINTTTATPANYQIKLTIPFAQEMNIDFSDLRFVTKTSPSVSLDYWIESSTPGVTADIWVELADAINASSSDYIYMHYGNPNLTSISNGSNTFIQWHGAAISTFADSFVKNAPLISEHRGRITSSTHDVRWGVADAGTFTDAATVELYSTGNARYFNCYHNGTIFVNIGETPTLTVNQYYRIKVVLTATELHAYIDNDEIVTGGTSSVLTDHNMGLFMLQSSGTSEQEWSFIRQYIAIEPTTDSITGPVEAMNTFSKRKALTISNSSGGPLIDYQTPVTVAYMSSMQANFNDIRFVDSSGNLLPYWIESSTPSSTALFWIKVNLPNYGTSPTGDNTIYMYYGNPYTTSASDGINTFIFFDDFNYDLSKWSTSGTPAISNSILSLGISNAVRTINTYGAYDIAVRTYQKAPTAGSKRFGFTNIAVGSDLQTASNSAHFILQGDGNQHSRTVLSGTNTQYANSTYSTTYVTREISWISGNVKFYTEGSLTREHTTNIPTTSLYIVKKTVNSINEY